MNFKQWIENNQIGKWWATNMPSDYPFIDSEVNKFAEDMSDSLRNGIFIYKILDNQKFGVSTFYGPKDICDNLLNIKNSQYLEDAIGGVTDNINNVIFAMITGGGNNDSASIIMLSVPMTYNDDDKLLFKSMVIHELRHAADYHTFRLRGGDSKDFSSDHLYEISLELYAKHIFEARAYAEQLKWLMKKLNKPDAILQILKRPLGFPEPLREFAETFIKELTKNKYESFQHHTDPPAIIDTDIQDQAVNLLKKIFEILRFSNNMRKL